MIGKKSVNPIRFSSKESRIRNLFSYMFDPLVDSDRPKCIYSGARGFLTNTREGQMVEMLALASANYLTEDPITHFVLSWRAGEHPTPAQVEEAIDITLEEAELRGHQCIYSLHGDTDNIHLHICINRVNPRTLACIRINLGWDVKTIQRASARIEYVQGWEPERTRLYEMQEDGTLICVYEKEKGVRQPSQRCRDMELRTGTKSAERIAQEEGAPIICAAKSWEELHQRLAEKGMRYEKCYGGAKVFVGKIAVKASRVHHDARRKVLEREDRLGEFQPRAVDVVVAARAPEPLDPASTEEWRLYTAERRSALDQRRQEKHVIRLEQQKEMKTLRKTLEKDRKEKLRGWTGSFLGFLHERDKILLLQEQEINALRQQQRDALILWGTKHPVMIPSFSDWRRNRRTEEPVMG